MRPLLARRGSWGKALIYRGLYFYSNDNPETKAQSDEGNATLRDCNYANGQWVFGNSVSKPGGYYSASITMPDGKSQDDVPIGITIVSGDGSEEQPFEFDLVYDHSHNWSYAAEGDTITATCNGEGGCPWGEQTAKLLLFYDRNEVIKENPEFVVGKEISAYVDKSGYWSKDRGLTAPSDVEYASKEPGIYDSTEPPTEPGSYYAQISVGDAVARIDFTIKERESIAFATVTVEDATYTGKALTPPVTVKLGESTLTRGTDYTVSYANNTKVGKAKVTVTGIDAYSDTKSAEFTIAKAANPMKVTAKAKTLKAKKLKKKAQSYKAIAVSKNKGAVSYKVKYANAKSKKALKFKNGKVTVKKGTKKGTYKVTVKVTAKGNANYKGKTVTKTVKVKVK